MPLSHTDSYRRPAGAYIRGALSGQ